jgi:translation initiation factor IF-2
MDEKKKIKIKIKKKPDEVASKQEVGEEINKSETPLPSVPEPTLQEQPQQTEHVSQERKEVQEFRRERPYEKRFDKYREERRYKPSYHKGGKEKGEGTPFNREGGTKSQRDQGATTQYSDRFRKKEGGQQGQRGFKIGDRFAKPAPKPSGGPKSPRAFPITPPPKKTSIKESFKEPEIVEGEEEFVSKLDAAFIRKKKEETFAVPSEIEIFETITVGDLAKKMNVKASVVIDTLSKLGLTVTINDKIDADTATVVAEEFGAKVKVKSIYDEITIQEEPDDPKYVKEKVPVVTVMGHVDHGKTTLLDAIRNTRVVETESGGITQHIGASVVEIDGKKITFIDTPGHEAFTAMRAKGAKVTDIVVLVVAADDGVKEQTIEALNHAKDAKVPIVVAINKIDAPGANPERVKSQLSELGLIPDEWGGDTMYVEVSALKKKNIDKLLQAILLQAELMELKADHHKKGIGYVIESRVDPGRGVVFTLIVKNGVVKTGDFFVVGNTWGKIRAIFDDKGRKINEILPGLPGEIVGAEELPNAGDKLNVVEDEDIAKEVAEKRKYYSKIENVKSIRSYEEAFAEKKEIKFIVKTDVFGSAEAIKYSLEKLSTDEVTVKVIHFGVGQVTESDVMLASASGASIIAFRTKVAGKVSELAKQEKVNIKKYSIIYEIIEDIQKQIKGLKEPVLVENVLGTAEVRKVFRVSGVGNVAGAYVKSGVIQRKAKVRIYRDGKLVFDGEIASLKRFKDDVSEVSEGYEFGISFKNFDDIKEGDTIECYTMVEQQE